MMKYLIIQLCESAPSFCHYGSESFRKPKLIPIESLKNGIRWAMMHNLQIQYVYPDYILPDSYQSLINSCEHSNICPVNIGGEEDICVAGSLDDEHMIKGKIIVIRLSINMIINNVPVLIRWLRNARRLNIVITDYENLTESNLNSYKESLMTLAEATIESLINGHDVSCNLLTDRIQLGHMNNCNAGTESITLAPDGNFYICPAFYADREPVGSLENGLNIRNSHLLTLQYAPVCRICDAFHCRRCVWLNKHTTLEVNTPGHEQCVASHIERNVSSYIARQLSINGILPKDRQFDEETCLDPFYKLPRIQLK